MNFEFFNGPNYLFNQLLSQIGMLSLLLATFMVCAVMEINRVSNLESNTMVNARNWQALVLSLLIVTVGTTLIFVQETSVAFMVGLALLLAFYRSLRRAILVLLTCSLMGVVLYLAVIVATRGST